MVDEYKSKKIYVGQQEYQNLTTSDSQPDISDALKWIWIEIDLVKLSRVCVC